MKLTRLFLSTLLLVGCSSDGGRADGGLGSDGRPGSDMGADVGQHADGAGADAGLDARAAPVYGIFQLYGDEYAEFRQQMGQSLPQYWSFVDDHVADLGVRYTRTNTLLIWGLVEPTLGAGYSWDNDRHTDAVIQAVYAPHPGKEMGFLAVIHPGRGPKGSALFPSGLEQEYQAYVQAVVERYDGDGDEVGPHVAVKHWQVMNEPFFQLDSGKMTVAEYAELVKLTAAAVRQADPGAKVVLGDVGKHLPAVIAALSGGGYFDVIDIHFWCLAEPCDYEQKTVAEARKQLDASGYAAAEIWMGEFGTYVNHSPAHSPADQARWLIKGMLANRALGVTRVLWNNLVSWTNFGGQANSPFNFMGLLTNGVASGDAPGDVGNPRLAYYAYKRLIAETGSATATMLGEHPSAVQGARALLFERRADGARFTVTWSDQGQRTIALPCEGTEARIIDLVPSAGGTFSETSQPCTNAKVEVAVGQSPLLVTPR